MIETMPGLGIVGSWHAQHSFLINFNSQPNKNMYLSQNVCASATKNFKVHPFKFEFCFSSSQFFIKCSCLHTTHHHKWANFVHSNKFKFITKFKYNLVLLSILN